MNALSIVFNLVLVLWLWVVSGYYASAALPRSPFVNWYTRPIRAALLAHRRHHSYRYTYAVLKCMDRVEEKGTYDQEFEHALQEIENHYPADYAKHLMEANKRRQS